MGLNTVRKEEVYLECSETFKDGRTHGRLQHGETTCMYCDKCEHGVPRSMTCLKGKCGDLSWENAPLTRDEFDHLIRYMRSHSFGCFRNSPYPRQYRAVSLTELLIQRLDYNTLFPQS